MRRGAKARERPAERQERGRETVPKLFSDCVRRQSSGQPSAKSDNKTAHDDKTADCGNGASSLSPRAFCGIATTSLSRTTNTSDNCPHAAAPALSPRHHDKSGEWSDLRHRLASFAAHSMSAAKGGVRLAQLISEHPSALCEQLRAFHSAAWESGSLREFSRFQTLRSLPSQARKLFTYSGRRQL